MYTCQVWNENASHFFIHCLIYVNKIVILLNEIRNYHPFNLDILLHGTDQITNEENLSIFDATHGQISQIQCETIVSCLPTGGTCISDHIHTDGIHIFLHTG